MEFSVKFLLNICSYLAFCRGCKMSIQWLDADMKELDVCIF